MQQTILQEEANVINTIKNFKKKVKKEGRSFKWFYKTHLKGISYQYFIIQLNDPERIKEQVQTAIEKYLDKA